MSARSGVDEADGAALASDGALGSTPSTLSTSAAGLDLPHDDGLLGDVVRLNLLVNQVLDGIGADQGIAIADYLVLGTVRRSPEHHSAPTALCEILGRTTGGMSLTLDRLEAAGWVRRLPDPGDRRRIVVEATDAGLDLAHRVNESMHAWEASLTIVDDRRRIIGAAMAELAATIRGSLGR